MRLLPLMVLAGTLVLAGCGRQQPEAPAELNNSAETPVNAAVPPPIAAAPVGNVAERAAPPLEFTDDAQMRDDADATGLTARLPREGDGATATPNATAPRQ